MTAIFFWNSYQNSEIEYEMKFISVELMHFLSINTELPLFRFLITRETEGYKINYGCTDKVKHGAKFLVQKSTWISISLTDCATIMFVRQPMNIKKDTQDYAHQIVVYSEMYMHYQKKQALQTYHFSRVQQFRSIQSGKIINYLKEN